MATGLIESLLLTIGIDTEEAQEGLEDVQQGMADTAHAAQTLDSQIKGFANGLKGLIGPLAGMFTAGKLFHDYLDIGDELGDLSGFARMSVRDLDAWSKATEAAGGNAQQFQKALREWTNETGRSGEDFIRLGNSTRNMSSAQAAAVLKSMHLTAQAGEIFMQSKERADELVASFQATAFTDQDAENARKFRIAWQNVGSSIQGIANVIIRGTMPVILKLSETFNKALRWAGEHIELVQVALTALSASFAATFGGKVLSVLRLVSAPIFAIIAAVAALALAVEDVAGFVRGDNSLFEEMLKGAGFAADEIESLRQTFAELFGSLDTLSAALAPIGAKLRAVFGPTVQNAIKAVVGTIEAVVTGLVALITGSEDAKAAFKALAKAALSSIGSLLVDLIKLQAKFGQWLAGVITDSIAWVLSMIGKGLNAAEEWIADQAKEIAAAAIDAVSSAVSAAEAWIAEKVKGIAAAAVEAVSSVLGRVSDAGTALFAALRGGVQNFLAWFGTLDWKGLVSGVGTLVRGMVDAVLSGIGSIVSAVWKQIAETITNGLKKLLPAPLARLFGNFGDVGKTSANKEVMAPAVSVPLSSANAEIVARTATAGMTQNNSSVDNSRHETHVTVDARGAENPAEIGRAVEKGVNRANALAEQVSTGVVFGGD